MPKEAQCSLEPRITVLKYIISFLNRKVGKMLSALLSCRHRYQHVPREVGNYTGVNCIEIFTCT